MNTSLLCFLTLTLCLTVICGCGTPKSETQLTLQAATNVMAGHIVFGHEVRTFRSCNTLQEVWMTDNSSVLWPTYDALDSEREPYDELFAIVRGTRGAPPAEGFGAAFPAQISVDQVLYVAQEGHNCSLDVTSFWARGAGNEPFWSVVVSETGIAFATLEGDHVDWDEVTVRINGDTTHFAALGETRIDVAVIDQPCTDSMSGAFHAYSTTVTFNDTTFHGCVIHGAGPPPSNN